ncbi:alpha/beta hydrolase fold domain-containing protein [Microbulbifer sp. SA54]|uniref:alpha/beta hydrolase fold domain-containing protein n=1 Tax=Microbulbifer sp. SA54 TaxID=3401577 RepID=UPI003AAC6CC8
MRTGMSRGRVLLAFSVLLFAAVAEGKPVGEGFPVDNSFTLDKAFAKYRRDFPHIEIARVAPAAGVAVERGLVYRQLGKRPLHLDLFRPAPGTEVHGAVLLVHGGGWRSGNRTLQEPMATFLANRGFVAATLEYRLSPEARYPAAVVDIKAALRWLRQRAGDYGFDPGNLAILGASAGGQLANLVGVTPGVEIFGGDGDPAAEAVKAIVNLDGVVSFTTPLALKYENDPRKQPSAAGAWFGGTYEEVPELWRQASPLVYVDNPGRGEGGAGEGLEKAGENLVPTLFVNSSQPRFHAGRDDYRAKLQRAGVATEVMTHPQTPHAFWLFEPWFAPTAARVEAFLQQHFSR